MTLTWHEPSVWALLLLVFIPLLAWRMHHRSKTRTSVPMSTLAALVAQRPTWRSRLLWLLPVLELAGLTVLIVAIARPQLVSENRRVLTEGIAIQLVVDRSGSMRTSDFRLGSQQIDRLAAVQHVLRQFILGQDPTSAEPNPSNEAPLLPGRANDLIGLVVFGTFADVSAPLTLDHDYVVRALNAVTPPDDPNEGRTAIGEGLGLAVEQLQGLDRSSTGPAATRIKSRVIVLLTDGENNAGDVEPMQAAELAAQFGYRVYTIGVGTKGEADVVVGVDRRGRPIVQRMQTNIDEPLMTRIAETTGGRYFRATDTSSLQQIYAEIDQLEKTRTQQRVQRDVLEPAVRWFPLAGIWWPPLLMTAFALLALQQLLAHTVLRRLP